MKPVELHPEAEAEVGAAVAYYQGQRQGLGFDFQAEVEAAINQIQQAPQMFPSAGRAGMRKCFVRRFPYKILFAELDDRIWVVAVAHQKRKPDYWSHRAP